MKKKDGFLKYDRKDFPRRLVKERVNDFKEVYKPLPDAEMQKQASRCMDCGVPFCHQGCPLGNLIPDFNEAVMEEDWELAGEILLSTNNFPEFTGRICPAPCEASCVLAIHKPAVTIENIEKSIAEKIFVKGWFKLEKPEHETGKRVAIVGSGPAGLAAAEQLFKAGHAVTVFEKSEKTGGLLQYGIPDFKLEKWVVQRRVEMMKEAGIQFKTGVDIGQDTSMKKLYKKYDAVLLCIGSTRPRQLNIPGNHLQGIHFAMDYLTLQNEKIAGKTIDNEEDIVAADKNVLVIGGGDTGSDCVGTANRQKAKSITQLQYRVKPSTERQPENPWPEWPLVFTESTSHEEGVDWHFGWLTKEFIADESGHVKGLKVVELEWKNNREYIEKENKTKVLPCDLALIAIGYEGPDLEALTDGFQFELDARDNIKAEEWQTNIPGIFVAGDAYRGQSLVVWAISDGREAARAIDVYLMGDSNLPSKERSALVLE